MDSQDLSRVQESFEAFHAHFAPTFGRKQGRQRSRDSRQALLVPSQQRGNAQNRSEVVEAAPRALPRFLSEAPWDDDAVTAARQKYLAPRLAHPQAVWAVDPSLRGSGALAP